MTDNARKDAVIYAEVMRAEARMPPASFRIRSHLWLTWTEIAVEHEANARDWREQAVSHRQGNASVQGEALGHEFRAALVSVCAAAFAIDALYGAVKPLIPVPAPSMKTWTDKHTSRDSRIFETLKLGFRMGDRTSTWPREFRWLFRQRRDHAVHFSEASREVLIHPTGIYTSEEQVSYAMEAATRATDLAVEVLTTCADSANPQFAGLSEEMEAVRVALPRILQARQTN
jgi:hypothetical protein